MPEGCTTVIFEHPTRGVRRRALKAFLADLNLRLGGSPVTCVISTDARLRSLNQRFLGKDYPTDVLSFAGPDNGLAISYDRAAAQAAERGHGVEEELRILILHGLLHLTGLDHERDDGEMARAETRWRKRLGLPHGLIERGLIERARRKA